MTQDYTRWNRAGLDRLRYVDGNAATYLEDLRRALRLQFAGEPEVLRWLGEAPADETLADWQARLLAQYRDERRDYGWEMMRTLSRALHVLSRYMDAYGNERYLRTATQWDNLRRLVAMLDYRPAPPASAETWLALLAKTDDAAIGAVAAGLAVQNQPADGGAPVLFETLDDLEVDYRLNRMRVRDHDRSPHDRSLPAQGGHFEFTWDTRPEEPTVGEWAVLASRHDDSAIVVRVAGVGTESLTLECLEADFAGAVWPLADLRLHRLDQWRQAPRLNGPEVLAADDLNVSVGVGDLLVYRDGADWKTRRVTEREGSRLRLDAPVTGHPTFYLAQSVKPQSIGGGQRFIVPRQRHLDTLWTSDQATIGPDQQDVIDEDGHSTGDVLYDYVEGSRAEAVFYLPRDSQAAITGTVTPSGTLAFDGKPGKLASGQWLALQGSDGQARAARILSIDEHDGYFELTADPAPAQGVVQAFGRFRETLPHLGYNRNTTPAYDTVSSRNSRLRLLLDEVPAALAPGRPLWIEGESEAVQVTVAEILSHDPVSGVLDVSVTPGLAGFELPRATTWVYGNVVRAGHGESRGEQVLGNGDRTVANPSFRIDKTDLAFVRDAGFSSGVRAAIEVVVEGRIWTQVDNLGNSGATDWHYSTRLTETGELLVQFGDGTHGRRLPTGTNNVRIRTRHGHGLAGNLPAHNLNKLKKPHTLVDGVLQPADATGGGEPEGPESVREQAPASVLTLKRAVSLEDYARMAESFSAVWRARALRLPDTPGATDRVEVVVVPAGGGALGDLEAALLDTLSGHTRPGVLLTVSRFQPVLLGLDVRVRVDPDAFDPDPVRERVRLALEQAFALEQAHFARPLFRSRLFEVVEGVLGVMNADCRILPDYVDDAGLPVAPHNQFIAGDGTVRRVNPGPRQVLYLDAGVRPPLIRIEEVRS